MPSMVFRQRAISIIRNAMHQFSEASGTKHPGLQGEIRELSAKGIFAPFLPVEIAHLKHVGKSLIAMERNRVKLISSFTAKGSSPLLCLKAKSSFSL